jgi:hypothetical protein
MIGDAPMSFVQVGLHRPYESHDLVNRRPRIVPLAETQSDLAPRRRRAVLYKMQDGQRRGAKVSLQEQIAALLRIFHVGRGQGVKALEITQIIGVVQRHRPD